MSNNKERNNSDMKKTILAILMALSLNVCAATDEDKYEELISSLSQHTEAVAEVSTEKVPSFPNVSTQQANLLVLAHQIAEKDGHKEPKLLQGLLMQETRAGADPNYKRALNRCYGVLQLKIAAAQDVLKAYPELATKYNIDIRNHGAIKKKLIHDDEFNLMMGSRYLLILRTYGYSTMKQMALAWNQGAGGAKRFNADTFPYVKGVVKHVKTLYAK